MLSEYYSTTVFPHLGLYMTGFYLGYGRFHTHK